MKKIILALTLLLVSMPCFATVNKSGKIKTVQIWGPIAKAVVCSGENQCTTFWVALNDSKSSAVLSTWLAAKMANSNVYVQGHDPDNNTYPYSGASKFYGMNVN